MNICVFGGANPRAGDSNYEFAYALGYQLGAQGYTVVTGGYHGSMQAASQGASDAGSRVIGVTCQEIENCRDVRVNPFVNLEHKEKFLTTRIDKMIEISAAAIALPGGVGTLAEIAVMWNRLLLGSVSKKPLIAIGKEWRHVLGCFRNEAQGFLTADQFSFIQTTDTIEDTIIKLKQLLKDTK